MLLALPTAGAVISDVAAPLISGLAAAALFAAAIALERRSRRLALAWRVLGMAQVCVFAGDLLWLEMELVLQGSPSPSVADLFYLASYPLFLIGVLLMPAREDTNLEWVKKAIDMLIAFLAGGLVIWNYLVGPQLLAGAAGDLAMLINLAYPLGDLLLLLAVLMILFRPSGLEQRSPLWLLAAALGGLMAFNLVFLQQSLAGTYASGGLVDLSYNLGNALVGLAGVRMATFALRPRPLELDPAALDGLAARRHPDGPWQILLPYGCVAGAYLLLIMRDINGLAMNREELYLFVGLLIALVTARQLIVLWENRTLAGSLQHALEQVRSQTLALEQTNREMQVEIEERRRAEERLTYDAMHDALTGLPNRALFIDRLAQASRKRIRHPDFQFAVLFLDVDSFKVINDSLGHIAGDLLLMRVARILERCVRASDTVARLGGDEFVILLEDISQTEDAVLTAERLLAEMSQPIALDGTRVYITSSIGIVQHVADYDSPEDVLRDADLAMYQAKSRGKARYEIFQADMRASAISRLEMENDLRRALELREFVLHYQPILALPDRRLVGFEALVRWNDPARGLVPPAAFIPVAEETGLILPLGRWILYEACRQCREWLERYPGEPQPRVSVNISGKQLQQADFVQMVAQALRDTGLESDRLTLEVTETVCLDNLDHIAHTLEALKMLGVETQIDDFGTGYSSLSYLQRLPVESIKIDRSFIQSIQAGTPAAAQLVAEVEGGESLPDAPQRGAGTALRGAGTPDIVRAILSMVNDLGIKAIAEGIETEVQLAELSRLKCAYVQGYLLAMPMAEDEVVRWLDKRAGV